MFLVNVPWYPLAKIAMHKPLAVVVPEYPNELLAAQYLIVIATYCVVVPPTAGDAFRTMQNMFGRRAGMGLR